MKIMQLIISMLKQQLHVVIIIIIREIRQLCVDSELASSEVLAGIDVMSSKVIHRSSNICERPGTQS